MNKIHNPITRKVDELRQIWSKAMEKHPDKTLIRMLMKVSDIDLLNGFLKWESSEQGLLPEMFVILFSPFEHSSSFSYQIAKDFIEMYKFGAEQDSRFNWDYSKFSELLATPDANKQADRILIQILESYKEHLNMPERDIILGFIPQYIKDPKVYNSWLHELLKEEISAGIKFMVLDHTNKEFLSKVCEDNRDKAMTIHVKNMYMNKAMEAVATAGNPNDPQIQIRKCMFEMGRCLPNRKTKLHKWGEQLLRAGQRAGDPSTYASTYLIYAGFVMHFRDEKKSAELIDKGLEIVKKYVANNEQCIPVYAQLLGYKAANLTMNGKHGKAVDQFLLQAQFAIKSKLNPIAISAYKTAVYLSHEHRLPKFEMVTFEAYEFGKGMADQELAHTEYSFIAYHYMKQTQLGTKEDRVTLDQRMISLYGTDWKENMATLLSSTNFKRKEAEFNLVGTVK